MPRKFAVGSGTAGDFWGSVSPLVHAFQCAAAAPKSKDGESAGADIVRAVVATDEAKRHQVGGIVQGHMGEIGICYKAHQYKMVAEILQKRKMVAAAGKSTKPWTVRMPYSEKNRSRVPSKLQPLFLALGNFWCQFHSIVKIYKALLSPAY